MVNNEPAQLSRNVFPSPLQHPEEVTTLRRVRQDKPHPPRVRRASIQPVVHKKRARTHQMDTIVPRPQNYSTYKKHSAKRRTVQLSGWGSPTLKAEMKRIAESEGITLSQTIVAACEELVHQKLQRRREMLEKPILEAFFDKKMNQVINRLAEFLGRSVYEGGQVRWLFINKLYREVIHPNKTLTKEEFYTLLDTSQKETLKAVKQWNPNIKDIVRHHAELCVKQRHC